MPHTIVTFNLARLSARAFFEKVTYNVVPIEADDCCTYLL